MMFDSKKNNAFATHKIQEQIVLHNILVKVIRRFQPTTELIRKRPGFGRTDGMSKKPPSTLWVPTEGNKGQSAKLA